MMDEKKFTDDTEIDVGIIENTLAKDTTVDVWLFKNSCWRRYPLSKILDIIHRLQDKIAEYERKLADGELVSKEWHDEQVLHDKEEIERLKTELSESRSVINTAHYKYHDYKDYQAYCINELQEQKVELLKANAELQKQVDELKSRKIEPLIVKCPSLETCPKVERAVKDTAKELSEFKHDTISHTTCWGRKEPVTRPPQSWCYVE